MRSVELVSAQSGVCSLKSSSGHNSLSFSIGEESMHATRGTKSWVPTFCFAVPLYPFQLMAHIAFLKEGGIVKSCTVARDKDGGASVKIMIGCFGV